MQNRENIFKFDFIFLLVQLIFLIKLSNSYIVLPLDYLPKINYKFIPKEDYTNNPQLIMKELYFKRLITYINIGTPSKSQMLFIDTDSTKFFLVSLNPPHQSHKETKISEFYDFGEKLFFNETESTSYRVEECKERNYSDYDEVCFAKDKILFNFGNYTNNPQLIMKELYFKRLITYINIGTPSKSQMLFIDTDSTKFFLVSLNPPHQSHKETKISEFYDFGEKLFFNETESTSYRVEECKERNYSDYDEVCFAKDKILFNFGNHTKTLDFPIKILKGEDESFPGKIGLSANSTLAYGTQNLISELKFYNLIKDYYFFFDFEKFLPINSEIKGNLIIYRIIYFLKNIQKKILLK